MKLLHSRIHRFFWLDWRTEVALDLKPVKGGRQHRLRVALKMAWRDIRRHRGRSALIISLIALPVLAMSFAATVGMSMMPTAAETVAMELGQTQGRLSDLHAQNAVSVQPIQGDLGFGFAVPAQEPDDQFVPSAPLDVVPSGFTVIPWQTLGLTSPVGKASVEVQTVVTDALNPAFKGKYVLLGGRAPDTSDEALGSPGLMERFALKIGEKITTSAGTFTIAGTLRTTIQGDGESVLFLTQEQIPAPLLAGASAITPYLVGQDPLTWADAQEFNTKGVMVTSRNLLLEPPSKAELGSNAPYMAEDWRNSTLVSFILMGSLIGVLALMEVGLLAGAAFAVGARKQQRDLALLAASGAESSMVRATVTASGLWLGLAGGIVGAVAGSIAAVVTVLVMQTKGGAEFPGLHLMWLPTLGLMFLGVIAGVVAAMIPARAVAKQATLAALKSGRTAESPSKWTTRIGLTLLVLSAVAMAASGVVAFLVRGQEFAYVWVPLTSGLVIAGAVVLIIALICLTGRIVDLLTARTSWLPIPLRLAARDSARNKGRTVPAVAAVLAAATLSGALMVGTASAMQASSDSHMWQYNLHQTGIALEYQDDTGEGSGSQTASPNASKIVSVDPAPVTAVLKDMLGSGTSTDILSGSPSAQECWRGFDKGLSADTAKTAAPCVSWALAEPVENRCELAVDLQPKDVNDWRCQGSMSNTNYGFGIPPIAVGGEKELSALLGRQPSSAALQTLADGGIVVTNRVYLQQDNTANLITFDPTAGVTSEDTGVSPLNGRYMREELNAISSMSLPGIVEAPEKRLSFYGFVSPETAVKLGMPVKERLLLVTALTQPSQAETDKIRSALTPYLGSQSGGIYFEGGPPGNVATILWLIVIGGALITLSAAGITAGLALADGRNDHATLASIGADTGLRKALAGSQTLMTAMLGTVLGLFAGAVPVIVVLSLQRGFPIVLPWLQIGALMLLVPLFGAAAAWMFTKGKLPMTRRQTLA